MADDLLLCVDTDAAAVAEVVRRRCAAGAAASSVGPRLTVCAKPDESAAQAVASAALRDSGTAAVVLAGAVPAAEARALVEQLCGGGGFAERAAAAVGVLDAFGRAGGQRRDGTLLTLRMDADGAAVGAELQSVLAADVPALGPKGFAALHSDAWEAPFRQLGADDDEVAGVGAALAGIASLLKVSFDGAEVAASSSALADSACKAWGVDRAALERELLCRGAAAAARERDRLCVVLYACVHSAVVRRVSSALAGGDGRPLAVLELPGAGGAGLAQLCTSRTADALQYSCDRVLAAAGAEEVPDLAALLGLTEGLLSRADALCRSGCGCAETDEAFLSHVAEEFGADAAFTADEKGFTVQHVGGSSRYAGDLTAQNGPAARSLLDVVAASETAAVAALVADRSAMPPTASGEVAEALSELLPPAAATHWVWWLRGGRPGAPPDAASLASQLAAIRVPQTLKMLQPKLLTVLPHPDFCVRFRCIRVAHGDVQTGRARRATIARQAAVQRRATMIRRGSIRKAGCDAAESKSIVAAAGCDGARVGDAQVLLTSGAAASLEEQRDEALRKCARAVQRFACAVPSLRLAASKRLKREADARRAVAAAAVGLEKAERKERDAAAASQGAARDAMLARYREGAERVRRLEAALAELLSAAAEGARGVAAEEREQRQEARGRVEAGARAALGRDCARVRERTLTEEAGGRRALGGEVHGMRRGAEAAERRSVETEEAAQRAAADAAEAEGRAAVAAAAGAGAFAAAELQAVRERADVEGEEEAGRAHEMWAEFTARCVDGLAPAWADLRAALCRYLLRGVERSEATGRALTAGEFEGAVRAWRWATACRYLDQLQAAGRAALAAVAADGWEELTAAALRAQIAAAEAQQSRQLRQDDILTGIAEPQSAWEEAVSPPQPDDEYEYVYAPPRHAIGGGALAGPGWMAAADDYAWIEVGPPEPTPAPAAAAAAAAAAAPTSDALAFAAAAASALSKPPADCPPQQHSPQAAHRPKHADPVWPAAAPVPATRVVEVRPPQRGAAADRQPTPTEPEDMQRKVRALFGRLRGFVDAPRDTVTREEIISALCVGAGCGLPASAEYGPRELLSAVSKVGLCAVGAPGHYAFAAACRRVWLGMGGAVTAAEFAEWLAAAGVRLREPPEYDGRRRVDGFALPTPRRADGPSPPPHVSPLQPSPLQPSQQQPLLLTRQPAARPAPAGLVLYRRRRRLTPQPSSAASPPHDASAASPPHVASPSPPRRGAAPPAAPRPPPPLPPQLAPGTAPQRRQHSADYVMALVEKAAHGPLGCVFDEGMVLTKAGAKSLSGCTGRRLKRANGRRVHSVDELRREAAGRTRVILEFEGTPPSGGRPRRAGSSETASAAVLSEASPSLDHISSLRRRGVATVPQTPPIDRTALEASSAQRIRAPSTPYDLCASREVALSQHRHVTAPVAHEVTRDAEIQEARRGAPASLEAATPSRRVSPPRSRRMTGSPVSVASSIGKDSLASTLAGLLGPSPIASPPPRPAPVTPPQMRQAASGDRLSKGSPVVGADCLFAPATTFPYPDECRAGARVSVVRAIPGSPLVTVRWPEGALHRVHVEDLVSVPADDREMV
eukprot:TRINITY_DN2912_c0_g1_i4.p1 TRINITY_DN2912_c0_g1~~TRINITY_DN2912_c0_g1_i4.p1  ORF type:complete len:1602 (+),score=599.44 TRINITY_DN2912_c0_g1_i4:52-4857(+)